MADLKISALTAATTPLAGTEVLPIVQGGVTTKVAVSNLTAGRAVTAASVNKVAITAPATASTLTIADGKTLTANNSLTLAGTDATTHTFPTTSATIARTDAAQTFTGDQTLATGNLVIGTDGKGIDFSATPGTGTSELLADYEEGTWTPTVVSYDGVMTVNGATYTKVGNLVKASASVTFDGTVDPSTVNIIGLPFAAISGANGDGGAITFCTNGTLKYADLSSTTNLRFYDTLGALVTYTTLGAANLQFVLVYSTT